MDDFFPLKSRKDARTSLTSGRVQMSGLLGCPNQGPKVADEFRQACQGLLMADVKVDAAVQDRARPFLSDLTLATASQGAAYKVENGLGGNPLSFAGRKRKISEISDLLGEQPMPGWQPSLSLSRPAADPPPPQQHETEARQHRLARERRRQFFSRTYRTTHPTGRVDLTVRGSPSALSHVEMSSLPFSRRLSSTERVAGRDALTSLIRRSLCGPLSSRTLPAATRLQPTLVRGCDPRPRTNSCLVNIAGRPARMSITVTRAQEGRAVPRHDGYPFVAAPLQVNNYVSPIPFEYQGFTASELSPFAEPEQVSLPLSAGSPPIYEEIVNLDDSVVLDSYMRGTDFRTIDAHTLVYKYTAPGSHSPKKRKTESHAEKCPICLDEIGHLEYVRRLPCLHLYHRDCIDRWLQINRRCPVCRNDITGRTCLSGGRGSVDADCSDALESDYEPLDDSEEDGEGDHIAVE